MQRENLLFFARRTGAKWKRLVETRSGKNRKQKSSADSIATNLAQCYINAPPVLTSNTMSYTHVSVLPVLALLASAIRRVLSDR
jgi:hypothetical protein